jgi:putative protease
VLSGRDEDGNFAALAFPAEKIPAAKPQRENLINQLTKTGNTIFETDDVRIDLSKDLFIPSSVLSDMRRTLIEKMTSVRKINYRQELRSNSRDDVNYPASEITYTGNVFNHKARLFFEKHGAKTVDPAFESSHPKNVALMFSKHCIKYSLGMCPKEPDSRKKTDTLSYSEPFYLIHKNVKMKLVFDCKKCEMKTQ